MDKWRQNLDQSLGEAPAAPKDEFEQILRKTRMERPQAMLDGQGQFWPALLFAASLTLAVFVSVYIEPQTEIGESPSSSLTMLSIEATSPYDESLERLQDLADQIE